MPEIIVKTVEIDKIAIDDRAWSAHATVKVMFAFLDQGSVLHRCRVHVNAKFGDKQISYICNFVKNNSSSFTKKELKTSLVISNEQ